MKTILIVEDIDLNIDLLTQLLEDDYNLLVAKDGAQGVDMALQNNPDLILMDISLPIMDGYDSHTQDPRYAPIHTHHWSIRPCHERRRRKGKGGWL